MAEATEQLVAARAEAADMKGIMADTARILDQKNAEVRVYKLLLDKYIDSVMNLRLLPVPCCDSLQPFASTAD